MKLFLHQFSFITSYIILCTYKPLPFILDLYSLIFSSISHQSLLFKKQFLEPPDLILTWHL